MRHYYHQANYHRAQRYLKRFKRVLAALLLVIILIGVGFGVDYAVQNIKEDDQKTITTATSGYYSAPLQIFRTPFFQFQTDDSWNEVTSESRPNTYVYRSLRDKFVEHELTIYVNLPKPDIAATRVLPVNITSGGELLPLKISEHCSAAFKPGETKSIKTIQMDGVIFKCDPHDSTYKVLVGLQHGSTQLALKRPDSSEATFTIVYSNITALPEGSQLEQITQTFQTR